MTSRAIGSWGQRAAPLILLGLAAPLLVRSAFSDSTLTVLLWVLVLGLLAAIFFTGFLNQSRSSQMPASPFEHAEAQSWLPITLVLAASLLLPIYAIDPHAETLLVIQALLVASTPVSIYFMARQIVGSAWVGCGLGLAYALYAPIHGAVFFDFHFLTAAPIAAR